MSCPSGITHCPLLDGSQKLEKCFIPYVHFVAVTVLDGEVNLVSDPPSYLAWNQSHIFFLLVFIYSPVAVKELSQVLCSLLMWPQESISLLSGVPSCPILRVGWR